MREMLGHLSMPKKEDNLTIYKCVSNTTTIEQNGFNVFLKDHQIPFLIEQLQKSLTIIKEKK